MLQLKKALEEFTVSAYHVERSIAIHAPIKKLRKILTDFREMRKWSPWLIIEPEAKVTFNALQGQVGATQSWEGKMVGVGNMELVEITDHLLVYALQFLKPFRAKSKVMFALSEGEGITTVSWHMYGNMPWFLFFMIKVMKTYIGTDYERGLTMLKEYAETGGVASQLQVIGEGEIGEIYYMGLERRCRINEVGAVMGKDFTTLNAYRQKHHLSKNATHFAIYKKFDFMQDDAVVISCIAIDRDQEVTPPFIRGKIKSSKVLNVRHTGNYTHLGNAWSLAMNYVRVHKLRVRKKPFGYEVYLNAPHNRPPKEWITEVMIPLKK